jgi:uncharacterized membrane protein
MAVLREQDADAYRFTVRPNCALSWQATKYVILFFAACFTAVAAYFASLGAWLVLPFAGLELVVLVAGFYLSALAGHTREVIEIRGDELRVLRGGRRLKEVGALSRHWTRVALVRDPRGWHPSRLVLRSHSRTLEIQTRLVEAEREELAVELAARVGYPIPASPARRSAPVPQAGAEGIGFREGEAHAMSRIRVPLGGD